ncbi:MAG: site-specific DNA-methyltransferase [Spirochaetaceae bacterium]|nr:site-specific DNA-methyltransferase [Spirochaetaceae bacterium]
MPSLHFKGKTFVDNHHLSVPFHELRPVAGKGTGKRASLHDNLIVHGDNLAALKALLPTYHNKVKCIYIDPPYNTGNEGWAYNDNVNSPMMQDWLGKTVDRDDLTRHDKWCCMMLPRLKLLRELLREDGVIFASIDDNEVHNLRSIMDEVFGDENFIGMIAWRNVTDNNPTNISIEHEYIVCYAASKERLDSVWQSSMTPVKKRLIEIGREFVRGYSEDRARKAAYTRWYRQHKAELGPLDRYKYIDDNGVYTGSQSVHNPGREGYRYDIVHPVTGKPCKQPLMGYRFPWDTMQRLLREDKILFGKDEDKIIEIKLYLEDYKAKLPSVIELDTRLGSYEIKDIFSPSKRAFEFPKPSQLIREIISFAAGTDSIVLDSFAGSGTTAHAVLALNQDDGGNRRFVLIECEDYADSITAERVRRVIRGVPSAKDANLKAGLGGSFSYFELGAPMQQESLLSGRDLPDYEALAGYVFFTATGEQFDPRKINRETGLIGRSRRGDVYLIYEPDRERIKDLALTLDFARSLPEPRGINRLVFAPTKYLDQEFLDLYRITFCQLPFQIYQAIDALADGGIRQET